MSVLTDITTPITQTEYVASLLSAMRANGVATDTWKDTTNLDYALVQVNASKFADSRLVISNFAKMVLLPYSTGEALRIFASSQYQVEKLLATPTIGTMRLVSAISAPAYNIQPGTLTVGTLGANAAISKLYTNTSSGTLNPGGTLDLTFQAVSTGANYNIPNTTALDLKTSLVGVSVSNPILPNAITWITSQGSDDETDDSLRQRCKNKWGTLGAGGTDGAYQYWAQYPINGGNTSPVTRVKSVSNLYQGKAKPAYTTVFVAGANGPLSNGDLAAVAANFENPQKYPAKFRVQVLNATAKFIPIIGTVNIYRSANLLPADVQVAVEDALLSYQKSLDIGSRGIYRDAIIANIFSRPNSGDVKINLTTIRNIDLASPANAVTVNYDEYPILQYTGGNLKYVLVD